MKLYSTLRHEGDSLCTGKILQNHSLNGAKVLIDCTQNFQIKFQIYLKFPKGICPLFLSPLTHSRLWKEISKTMQHTVLNR